MSRRFSILLFTLLWLWFAACAQGSAFWRDSGEFVIAGRYLDISHPGGFPLFGMLANLFSLLPIGPIAFRVNLLSSAAAALFIVLTVQNAALTVRILKPKGAAFPIFLATIAPVPLLLCSESFIKQALTAEVYLLNGVLLALLLRCYLEWKRTTDARWLLMLPFVAALTLGNHAASAVALLPAAVVVLIAERRELPRIAFPGAVAAIIGLLVYAYIPVRAHAHPPLNTGNPSSFSRFLLLVTDGRDRALRSESSGNDIAVVREIPRLEKIAITTAADARKLSSELSWPLAIAGALGLLLLIASAPSIGLVVAGTGLGTWFFFQGWDPDPWVPLFSSILIGSSVLLAWVGMRAKTAGCIAALVVLGCGVYRLRESATPGLSAALKDYEEPAAYAAAQLRALPQGAPLLSESAWFFLKYARDVEGIGEDHALLYQPAVLFPGYFTFPALRLPSGKFLLPPATASHLPNTEFAGKLISSLAPFGAIGVEAGLMNQFLSGIAQFRSNGMITLEHGIQGAFEEGFTSAVLERLPRAEGEVLSSFSSAAGDARHFTELKAVTTAELLAQASRPDDAAKLLLDLCAPIQGTACGEVALNNLGSYLNRVRKFERAKEVLEYLLERGTSQRSAVERNLAIAEAGEAAVE